MGLGEAVQIGIGIDDTRAKAKQGLAWPFKSA
jgi:hypothetical protein